MKSNFKILAVVFLGIISTNVNAQFNIDGQLVQRAEYRNGFGKLINKGDDFASFIGQRARLGAGYQKDNLSIHVSIQDIRTWGSAPNTKVTDGYLSVYEAWAQTKFGNSWAFKLGRQELNYDNARFLGNLDWAFQGRSHDFALAKYEKDKIKFHFGAGYNQDGSDNLTGSVYTTAKHYKTAQLARFERFTDKFSFSVLFWNDGQQFMVKDANNKVTYDVVRYRQTIGIPTLKYQLKNTTFSAFYYHQLGLDVNRKDVNAYDANVQVSQKIDINKEKGSALRLTLGGEILSGTDANQTIKNNSFSPTYGTNHSHNGYMDFFYVDGRHENGLGLQDVYLRAKYDVNSKTFVSLNSHYFKTHANVYDTNGNKLSKDLGVELDASFGYVYSEAISLQAGYSQMFAQDTFKTLQKANARETQNWAYIMLIYRPTSKNKFIGLQF